MTKLNIQLKSFLLAMLLVALPVVAFSQAKVVFCFANNEFNGAAEWSFNTITFAKDKKLRCTVFLDKVIPGLDKVTFKVQYQQNESMPFIDRDSYVMDIKPDWLWFYYPLSFAMPGNYKVIILDNNNKPLQESVLHLVP